MSLTKQQIRKLRALAHHLKPVVMVGQHGLGDAVMREVEIALDAHELIKIKLAGMEKNDRQDSARRICADTGAEPIQQIGHMLTIYRRNPDNTKIAV